MFQVPGATNAGVLIVQALPLRWIWNSWALKLGTNVPTWKNWIDSGTSWMVGLFRPWMCVNCPSGGNWYLTFTTCNNVNTLIYQTWCRTKVKEPYVWVCIINDGEWNLFHLLYQHQLVFINHFAGNQYETTNELQLQRYLGLAPGYLQPFHLVMSRWPTKLVVLCWVASLGCLAIVLSNKCAHNWYILALQVHEKQN